MDRRTGLAVAAASVCASLALAGTVGAATPEPGVYTWDNGTDQIYGDEQIDARVDENSKSFAQLRIIATCGQDDDVHIALLDSSSKDLKIKKGKFEIAGKVKNKEGDSAKKFVLAGKFTKPQKAPFSLSIDKCGKNREGKLKPGQS